VFAEEDGAKVVVRKVGDVVDFPKVGNVVERKLPWVGKCEDDDAGVGGVVCDFPPCCSATDAMGDG